MSRCQPSSMLKILFGRYSRFVRLVELAGVILSALIIYRWSQLGMQGLPDILFAFILVHYGWIRFCFLFPWYPGVKSGDPDQPELGIVIHFLKALVPMSYVLCLTAILYLLGFTWVPTILANVIMIVVSGVNVILVWFHWHDKDSLPVNFFTRELILAKEPPIAVEEGHKKHIVQVSGARKGARTPA